MVNEVTTEPSDPKPTQPEDVKPVNVSTDFKLDILNETGQTSISTDTISKKLDCIIIDSIDNVEIIIESELGYLLFHRTEHLGCKYYCIRQRTTTAIERQMDIPDFEKFNLNEKLIITVRGRKNSKISIIMRFD